MVSLQRATGEIINDDKGIMCSPEPGLRISMVKQSLGGSPENTHQSVLFHLKRATEMTVAELCEVLGITAMAVRRHLAGLQTDGLVESRLVRRGRGRP